MLRPRLNPAAAKEGGSNSSSDVESQLPEEHEREPLAGGGGSGDESKSASVDGGQAPAAGAGAGAGATTASEKVSSPSKPPSWTASPKPSSEITSTGLKVLVALAVQNCSKNLLVRYVMRDAPNFLLSAAVIGSEMTKITLSTLYILCVERRSLSSIRTYLVEDWANARLLAVPASVYNLQQTLEFVALSNLDAPMFSVLVQSKLLMTAGFSVALLGKKLRKSQVISLVLLTVGVVLCNLTGADLSSSSSDGDTDGEKASSAARVKGIAATLGIAFSSGFAAVYTEKVIKKKRTAPPPPPGAGTGDMAEQKAPYGLAYMQVQLALVSLIVMGAWAVIMDLPAILENGLFHNFTPPAFFSIFNSGVGGLMVAAVLKYADSVLKGYATAVSVILTGVLSVALFGTSLNVLYGLGIVNVICAVILYNANDLDRHICGGK